MELEKVKSLLPETVLDIAGLIGFPATALLIKALGGTTIPFGKGFVPLVHVAWDCSEMLSAKRIRLS